MIDEVERCGAVGRTGKPCKHPAGYGTAHVGIGKCKFHGGSTPTHNRAAALEVARRECEKLGVPIEVDPGEALIHAVWEAEGNLAFYRTQVQALGLSLTTVETGPAGAAKQVAHPLVVLYHEAERWRATVAASALKAGVEERRLQLAEHHARDLFTAVGRALVATELSEKQAERFRHELANELRRVAEPASLAR